MMRRTCQTLLLLCVGIAAAPADDSVVNSKHDLSAFGPGPVRAVEEDRVCIFCHAPHNASPAAPLWNRHNPTGYYRIYRSRSTDARIDQPGPESKMCLSCHDGTIALGLTLDRAATMPIPMSHTFMPTGLSNLTTDLSDDHPIGFRYDRALSNRDPQLRPVELVDSRIVLGPRGELECIACHDPHNNELGNFLRLPERRGAICITCHDLAGWELSAHANSPRSVPAAVTAGERLEWSSMADNACRSCHVSHSAPYRERLLYDRPSRLCITCHDGIGGTDILPVLDQRSGHRVNKLLGHTRPPERRLRAAHFVECTDCHNPHAVVSDPLRGPIASRAGTPVIPLAMREVPGVSTAGLPVPTARFYYEVCYRCHADRPVRSRNRIARDVDTGGNVRRQFLPTVASAHPVVFPARQDTDVPSLRPEQRNRQFISCQDCHNNPDAREQGGAGPNGPHTSRYDYLLAHQYETRDFTVESPQAYALCYECHDRNSILGDESFSFHSEHVLRGRSPCSACHSAHGVPGSRSEHDHLINFDLSIVQGRRFYQDTGRFRGTCTLQCHGVNHVNFTYEP
jgi:predicted CXXCH cytochrome family protein